MKLRDKYTAKFESLRGTARDVTRAYSDVNKWLDTLKEYVYIELGMPNLSDLIHDSSHTQLERLDVFGELLHERHLMQEYPTTQEVDIFAEMGEGELDNVFEFITRCYEHIDEALESFHEQTDNAEFRAMALKTEELMLANSKDYTTVLNLWQRWDNDGGSLTTFDNYVRATRTNKE